MHQIAGWGTHSLRFLYVCRPGAARRRDVSACFLQTVVQPRVLRQPSLWLTESQLLILVMRRADHRTNATPWLLCGLACGPAHACPPKTACPSSGHFSTCTGGDSARSFLKSRKITQRRHSQAWGLFRCPWEECSNDGMQNYTTLSDFSQIRPEVTYNTEMSGKQMLLIALVI